MKKVSIGSRIFDTANILLFIIFGGICIIPFLFVLSASLSDPTLLLKHDFIIFPVGFSLDAYKYSLFTSSTIGTALTVSTFMTLSGTFLYLVLTSLMAYPLAHTNVFGYKVIMPLIIFTLVFSGGMIPTYLVVQGLGLINTYWAVLLPGSVSAFTLIIFISFFKALPQELEEAAEIDGCNELRTLIQIILPISKPLLATFTLMFAVGLWNSWFEYVLYLNDAKMYSIQVVLKQLIEFSNAAVGDTLLMGGNYVPPTDVVRYCVIVISTLPILIVYPFLQKYFAKGIMLGSVKG